MGRKMIPFEKYSLIFKHEVADEDGELHLLDEPFVINGVISSFKGNTMIRPVNEMIHKMFEWMEYEAMCKYGE